VIFVVNLLLCRRVWANYLCSLP